LREKIGKPIILIIWWLQRVSPTPANVDINGDGIINIIDATLIGLNWLKMRSPERTSDSLFIFGSYLDHIVNEV